MRRAQSRGFGLMLTLFGMGVLVLTLGAAIDFSHIYLVRNELQAELDEVALRAARELDGTAVGIARASRHFDIPQAESARSEFFAFSTDRLSALKTEFARDLDGPWSSSPVSAEGYRFVRIQASAEAKLFFLPMSPGVGSTSQVRVQAVAGQYRVTDAEWERGEFSVRAANAEGLDFGFAPGELLPLTASGSGQCEALLAIRYRHDTDTTSDDYLRYRRFGNGQRVISAAVTAEDGEAAILGHATLLVPINVTAGGGCRAVYVGHAPVRNAALNGAGEPGLYEVRLFQ